MFLDHVEFQSNIAAAAAGAAGAIHISGGATIRGTHTVFESNSAASQLAGGAVSATSSATVLLSDSTLVMNMAHPHPEAGGLYGAGACYAHQAHLYLVRTVVHDNTATGGDAITASNFAAALYVHSPLTIKVEDSSFIPLVWGGVTASINPRIVNPGEVIQGSCQQHPCALGSSCSYANLSISCERCQPGTYSSDGISCQFCPEGYGKVRRSPPESVCVFGSSSEHLLYSTSSQVPRRIRPRAVYATRRHSRTPRSGYAWNVVALMSSRPIGRAAGRVSWAWDQRMPSGLSESLFFARLYSSTKSSSDQDRHPLAAAQLAKATRAPSLASVSHAQLAKLAMAKALGASTAH